MKKEALRSYEEYRTQYEIIISEDVKREKCCAYKTKERTRQKGRDT